ncbi:hypothetical protein PSAB6_450121 [Paraburkholderia sabiae]|nr:hypothetical protein PSAB6_450121 [Paraburkholderia sabiae]
MAIPSPDSADNLKGIMARSKAVVFSWADDTNIRLSAFFLTDDTRAITLFGGFSLTCERRGVRLPGSFIV